MNYESYIVWTACFVRSANACVQWVGKALKEAKFSFLTSKFKILVEVRLWNNFILFSYLCFLIFYFWFLFSYFICSISYFHILFVLNLFSYIIIPFIFYFHICFISY